MSISTMDLAEVENNFSKVTTEVNKSGRSVTVLKNNRPWVVIQPASAARNAVDVAVNFMDEYTDVFEELAE
ncbi:type II toxin-antitoxin system prevent-host-death family antitoxin [Lancefieldella rimae]|uniref:type II toxin-antitoxin system prevent-host-death family antitoxin n=1 Tax=Lancefieldella rimae TaxID=1383 RepID=UPI001CB23457|nr:type II toxin-antitoxin system prevent-host-death family antitoxin [Lancefieldella rimae]MBF4803725.1 type II toxin-antitoxin system prevent-host-death family antitoxin [Lancefieldella rimae]